MRDSRDLHVGVRRSPQPPAQRSEPLSLSPNKHSIDNSVDYSDVSHATLIGEEEGGGRPDRGGGVGKGRGSTRC